MIRNYQDFKPVKAGGQISLLLGLFITLVYFVLFRDPDLGLNFDIFAWVNIFWYILMGVGVIKQRIWGYYMLRSYLYLLAIGFPIGTYMGLKSLNYLKEKDTKYFFEDKTIGF